MTGNIDDLPSPSSEEAYVPKPTETKKVPLPANVGPVLERFAEHYHDIWCSQKVGKCINIIIKFSSIRPVISAVLCSSLKALCRIHPTLHDKAY